MRRAGRREGRKVTTRDGARQLGALRFRKPVPVLLVSDATGSLGSHVLETVFTQFPPGSFQLQTINFVNSEERLQECLSRLRKVRGLIVHATIYEGFKRRIEAVCRARRLPVYDLTGPTMAFLVSASGCSADISYQRLHELSSDYFQRIEAIEYAIAHDDGMGLRTLGQADVILTGISRTTKTPTSMVLATHGYRAANVPLVLGVEPPAALFDVKPSRVVCLMLDAHDVASFRAKRVEERLQGVALGYAREEAIRQELAWARRLAQRQGWALLDVTGRAIEETAARVIQLVKGSASVPPSDRVL